MEDSRRDFLKKAGLGSLAGLGVFKALDKLGVENAYASGSSDDTSGTRLGLVIDARKCKDGCTDCIDKCHAIHNVPKFDDPKDEIKWLWTDPFENVFPSKSHQFVSQSTKSKPFLALCNHCKEPSCVRVCPTKATFKRAHDGVVLMDFHRCIGCRFCMAACPYGARSFNWNNPKIEGTNKLVGGKEVNPDFPTRERGVVEKCNLCAERLAKKQIPACVEICKEEALVFGDLNNPNSKIRQILKSNHTIQRKAELGTGPSVFYIV